MSDLDDARITIDAALDESVAPSAEMSGTDLPVPLCGTGGSGFVCERCPHALLDAALAAVPMPAFDDTSARAVYRWFAAVEQGLHLRRERLALARAVHRAMVDEYRTREMVRRARVAVERWEAAERERDVGTYWTRRESGRRSQRAVRVDVDPQSWDAFKVRARQRDDSVGELLGLLASRAPEQLPRPARSETADRREIFLRIAIDDECWGRVRAAAVQGRVKTSRLLGVLVENHVKGASRR